MLAAACKKICTVLLSCVVYDSATTQIVAVTFSLIHDHAITAQPKRSQTFEVSHHNLVYMIYPHTSHPLENSWNKDFGWQVLVTLCFRFLASFRGWLLVSIDAIGWQHVDLSALLTMDNTMDLPSYFSLGAFSYADVTQHPALLSIAKSMFTFVLSSRTQSRHHRAVQWVARVTSSSAHVH